MDKTVFTEAVAEKPAELTPTQRFQAQIEQMGQLLLRQAQARGGQMDVLSMELRLRILQEHTQLLTELLIKATNSTLTDDLITRLMNARLDHALAQLDQELKAPLLARGAPSLNGAKSH